MRPAKGSGGGFGGAGAGAVAVTGSADRLVMAGFSSHPATNVARVINPHAKHRASMARQSIKIGELAKNGPLNARPHWAPTPRVVCESAVADLTSDLASLRIRRDVDPNRPKPLRTVLYAVIAVGALAAGGYFGYPALQSRIFK